MRRHWRGRDKWTTIKIHTNAAKETAITGARHGQCALDELLSIDEQGS